MLKDYEKPCHREWHDAERGHLQEPPPTGGQCYRVPPHINTTADVAITEAVNELDLQPGGQCYPLIWTQFFSVGPCAIEPVPLGPLGFVAVPFAVMADAVSHRVDAWHHCLHRHHIGWAIWSEVQE